jgi:hypothetical protein
MLRGAKHLAIRVLSLNYNFSGNKRNTNIQISALYSHLFLAIFFGKATKYSNSILSYLIMFNLDCKQLAFPNLKMFLVLLSSCLLIVFNLLPLCLYENLLASWVSTKHELLRNHPFCKELIAALR